MDLRDVIRPGDRCLDVGAGTGRATCRLADLVGRGGAVHAVEPRPGPRAVLRVRTASRRCVRVVAATIGATDDPWRAVHSVDGWCRRTGPVALLRLDASVSAPAVLAGAVRTLGRDRPVLLIDLVPHLLVRDGHRPGDVTVPLERAGYRGHDWRGYWTDDAADDLVGTCLFTPRPAPVVPLRRGTA